MSTQPLPGDPGTPHAPSVSPPLQTFLICDIRGSTRYAVEQGDEAWARVAMRFAQIAREMVEARGGQVLELRGDEAMAVFASARSALRAAVELQARFAQEMRVDSTLLLHSGIGLDAGEAVPVEGGFRGLALNLAARLCSLAGPGEVLASETVIGLAHVVAELSYTDRGQATLKGFTSPVRVVQVAAQTHASRREPDAPPSEAVVAAPASMLPGPSLQPLPIGGFLGALPSGALVAREAEVTRLRSALDAVAGRAGRLVLLVGEPGVGKTRLAQEVTLAARDHGFLVAPGRCYEPQSVVAFYPFLEALTKLYVAAPDAVHAELPKRWGEVARLLPDQDAGVPPADIATEGGPDAQQRLFYQVTSFVLALAALQPVALLLDDLHWADSASLTLLAHLARHTRSSRVLLLGTYRDVEVGRQHPLEGALRDLARERLLERVAVKRLSSEGTRALIAASFDQAEVEHISADFTAALYERTEGNPFFTREVLRALVEQGAIFRAETGLWDRKAIAELELPESIRSVIGQRVARLSETAQDILREASVLGQGFTFEELRAMTARVEAEVEVTLEEVVAAGLVREAGGDTYAFSHALIQQALYQELSARKRRRLHRAAGEALEAQLAGTSARRPQREGREAVLAYHFLQADVGERALPYAMRAGDTAEAVYAHDEAEKHYRIALELARERVDRASEAESMEKLGHVLVLVGRNEDALDLLDCAVSIYSSLGDLHGELRSLTEALLIRNLQGPAVADEGVVRLQSALARVAENWSSQSSSALRELVAAAYLELAHAHNQASQFSEELVAAKRAEDIARLAHNDRLLGRALSFRALALANAGNFDEALALYRQAIVSCKQADDLWGLEPALGGLCQMLWANGAFALHQRYSEEMMALAIRLSSPRRLSRAHFQEAVQAFFTGNWPQARKHFEQEQEIDRQLDPRGTSKYTANMHLHFGMLESAEGHHEQARKYLEQALRFGEGSNDLIRRRFAQKELAERDLLAGEAERAYQRLEPLLDLPGQEEADVTQLLPFVAWALLERGQLQQAGATADASVTRAAVQGRLALANGHRVQAQIAIRQEDWPAAQAALEAGLALTRSMPYPHAEAKALYVYGLLHAAEGEPEQAREKYQAALAICDRLGEGLYRPHIERALAALTASHSTDTTAPGGLPNI